MYRTTDRKRVVIMGAAGRDFHNFNAVYRENDAYEVIAFTAAQIPDIAGRRYPPTLAGELYPKGIDIVDEKALPGLCREQKVDQVVFAYSDIPHIEVMHKASIVLAAGADFILLGPERTMLSAQVPVIACCAVRTGCGKSQVTQWLSKYLQTFGLKVAVIRHPMPYGDLEKQSVQRFTTREDLLAAQCTIEEREEYEPHLELGNIVYAGVDYAKIVEMAEKEADVILWDGGNNDFSFIRPDLHIVLADPLRPGNENSHHPGEAVLRMADIVLVNKVNSASVENVRNCIETIRQINEQAIIVQGVSPVQLQQAESVRGKKVLIIEDGPTITHGGMPYGAGYIAAIQAKAGEILDPRDIAVEQIAMVYSKYPHIGKVLPAVGYHADQLRALEETINRADVDFVIVATPCNLASLIDIDKPVLRVKYSFSETEDFRLSHHIESFLRSKSLL